MTLQELFDTLVSAQGAVKLTLPKQDFNNLRTSLLRKYRKFVDISDSVGIDTYNDLFIGCSYDSATNEAVFELKHKSASQRIKKHYATQLL